MTDYYINRFLIGIVIIVVGYMIHLLFRKNKSESKEDYYRFSKISGEDQYKKPVNNLKRDLNLKYNEAILLYDANNFEESIVKLTECISESKFSEFYYYRGICNFAVKKYKESLDDWETAIKLFPEYEHELRSNINEAMKKLKG